MDHLNTPTEGAYYETFAPATARASIKRINFVFTPKHGSWLNIAECELSCLTQPVHCGPPNRRTRKTSKRNRGMVTKHKQRVVNWQFKINDARQKLKRLYPKIKTG